MMSQRTIAIAAFAAAIAVSGGTSAFAQQCVLTELSFTFSANPPQPKVGEMVTVTFFISATNTAGLPSFSLSGAAPLLTGTLMPDPPVSMSGPLPGSVSYKLTAVAAGEAMLSLSVFYEGVTGCLQGGGPVFGFLSDSSPFFPLTIDEAAPTFT